MGTGSGACGSMPEKLLSPVRYVGQVLRLELRDLAFLGRTLRVAMGTKL